MAEITPSLPFGRTTFCDDIRQEIGGKMTIVGSYSSAMLIEGDPPFTIPKFAFLVEYNEALNSNSPPVTLQIFLPGDSEENPSFAIDLPAPPNELPVDPFLVEQSFVGMRMPIELAPLVIVSEGVIKVRMKRGDDYVRLGSLVVRSAPRQEGA